jgi:cysteine-rich repeat protein
MNASPTPPRRHRSRPFFIRRLFDCASATPTRAVLRRHIVAAMATLALSAAIPVDALASHFRSGHLTWVATGGNSVRFTLQGAFRRNGFSCRDGNGNYVSCSSGDGYPGVGDLFSEDIGGTGLATGDGGFLTSGTGYLMFLTTSIDPANNWVYGLALDPASLPAIDTGLDYTYSSAGNYTATIESCCRISSNDGVNAHINNPDGNYRVETLVNVGSGNSSPQSSLPPVVNCVAGEVCTFVIPASDPNSDPLRYRLSTAAEAGSGYFNQPGPLAPVVDVGTGVFSWDTTGATIAPGYATLYSEQVTVEESSGASKSAVDFFIQLEQCDPGLPPVFSNECSGAIAVNAGETLDLDIAAYDPDAGDIVTLNAVGLPPGAALTPSLPASGNTVSTHLSWTPTIADVGTSVVTFTATDDCGAQGGRQSICSITVVASENCGNGLDDDGDGKIDCVDEDCRISCSICGDGILQDGEGCDDGNTSAGDCCSTTCQPETAGTPCSQDDGNACTDPVCSGTGTCGSANTASCDDGMFCNGTDTCAGGVCTHTNPPCPAGGCSLCDEGTHACSFAPVGTSCQSDGDECTNDRCDNAGSCDHPPIVMAPTCDWLVVGGSDATTGNVRTRYDAQLHGAVCADRADIGESSDLLGHGSWVLMEDSGSAVVVRDAATVAEGGVVTGGGCVKALHANGMLGTNLTEVCCADGVIELPPGGDPHHVIDTCGANEHVAECADAKAAITADIAALEALPSSGDLGNVRVPKGENLTVQLSAGLNVVDLDKLKVDQGGTLTLDGQGHPDVVAVLRIDSGLNLKLRARLALTGGLTANRTLLFARRGNCTIGFGNVGSGTLFCPNGKVRLRVGSEWNGAIAGGPNVDVGWGVRLTHAPFLGLAD